MKPLNVLVLSVSAGAGHVRAAQALCAQAELAHPELRLTHLDVMDFVSSSFRSLYTESYLKLVEKAPQLWAYLYHQTDKASDKSIGDRLRRAVETVGTRTLEAEIERLRPDAIVCTHFLPAQLLARRIRKRRATPPVWVQITDFDVHGLWLHRHMEGYFVANEESAARLHAKGLAANRIFITGIPIMPAFGQAPTREVALAELGLDTTRPVVLLMSGGAGVGAIHTLAARLILLPNLQVVALAGRNAVLLRELQKMALKARGRLLALGFTTTIERVMAAADIGVTKPGGLTSSECLAMSLPMIVVSPIPGQEERNADYLLESGAALKAVDTATLELKVRRLLNHPDELAAMRARAHHIARPHAARDVLKHIELHFAQRKHKT